MEKRLAIYYKNLAFRCKTNAADARQYARFNNLEIIETILDAGFEDGIEPLYEYLDDAVTKPPIEVIIINHRCELGSSNAVIRESIEELENEGLEIIDLSQLN
jgi:hypothetical protein